MGIFDFVQRSALRKFARDDISHASKLPGFMQTMIANSVVENISAFMSNESNGLDASERYQIIRHKRNNYGRNGPQSFTDPEWLSLAITENLAGALLRRDEEIIFACLAWIDANKSGGS